jgi:hypothetical protein
MSKEKPFENRIPAFYKKNAVDLMLFAYVCGMRRALPAVKTNKCVELYLNEFELSEDDYPLRSAIVTYERLLKDYFTSKKS